MVLRDNRNNNFYCRLFTSALSAGTTIGVLETVILDTYRWTYTNGFVFFPRLYYSDQTNVTFSVSINSIQESTSPVGPFTTISEDRLIGTYAESIDTFNSTDLADNKLYTAIGIGLISNTQQYLRVQVEFKGPVSTGAIYLGCDGIFYPDVYPFNTAFEQAKINNLGG